MKKILLLFLASIAICASVSAQSSELSFSSQIWRSGGVLQQDGTVMSPAQVREVMSGNDEALRLFNSGRTLWVTGLCVAIPSAALVGWDFASFLRGDSNGMLLGIGAAGVATGFVISMMGERRIRNSVQLYNAGANSVASYQINFGFTQSGGIGLSMRF